MNIKQKLRGAMRRIAEVSLAGGAEGKRRTVPLPSILNTYGPRPDAYPKPSPANLRRFAETPVARKAINTIKDQIAGMRWRIQPRPGRGEQLPDADLRIRILTDNFDAPNPDDSFRSLTEEVSARSKSRAPAISNILCRSGRSMARRFASRAIGMGYQVLRTMCK